jgi:hypothetical protein
LIATLTSYTIKGGDNFNYSANLGFSIKKTKTTALMGLYSNAGKKLIYPKKLNRHSGETKFGKKTMMSIEKPMEIGLQRLGN